ASAKGIDPALVSGEGGAAWLGAEPEEVHVSQGLPVTHMGWEIDPTGMFDVLQRLAGESGGIDLYVTENGCDFEDTVTSDRRCNAGPGTPVVSTCTSPRTVLPSRTPRPVTGGSTTPTAWTTTRVT